MPYSGSIGGPICVLDGGGDGGGDESFLASAFEEVSMSKVLPILIRLAVVLAPLLVASLFWAFYRYHVSSAAPVKGVTTAQSSAPPSHSQQAAAIDERLRNAERAIMFSIAPLTSLSAVVTPVDPDPMASLRRFIALSPGNTREPPRIDPRTIRSIVDHGVIEYASGKTDGDRQEVRA